MSYLGRQPISGNFQVLDALIATTTDTYALTKDTVAVFPQTPSNCIVSLNGVIQAPVDSYTISGSNIVFDSALTGSDSIDFITVLGDVLAIGTPSDGTVSFAKVTSNLITGATSEATIAGGDSVLIYDDSAAALRKMTRTNFVSGIANTPAFEAYLSSDQSVSDNTATKASINTELFDTDSCYDNATDYRFTPTTAGKYFVYCAIETDGGSGTNLNASYVYIYKNGSNYMRSLGDFYNNQIRAKSIYISTTVDMNGTSDYLEIYGTVDSISGSGQIFLSGTKGTRFGAYKLIGV